jgi:hypothetical protein
VLIVVIQPSCNKKGESVKLELNKTSLDGMPTNALLSHNGEEIEWNIALFDKTKFSEGHDIASLFDQINGFWAHLPVSAQTDIFETYKEIKYAFENVWVFEDLTQMLYDLVAKLMNAHDLHAIHHWINFYSDLAWPIDLKETYIDSYENPGTRERTYLKDEYKWLITMAVALRAMVPIWGEFISKTKSDVSTTYKEFYAYRLLAKANINTSEPMERLRVYVERSIPNDKSNSSAVLGGVSSEDFPIWILGLVLVRKLCIGDVRGINPNSSLIAFVYKYISQKVKSLDNSFIGLVKEKITDGQGQDGENNLSKLEGYKAKEEIPAGDVAIIAYYVSEIENMARHICPDIDLDLIRQSEESVKVLSNSVITEPQIILMRWVLKKAIPPQGLLHINKPLCLKAMAATQAILWHKGFYELAGLVSAAENTNSEGVSFLNGNESRARVSKEQVDILNTLFPYMRKPLGKRKVVGKKNPAIEAIDILANLFSEYSWRLTSPQALVEKITGNKAVRSYSVPHGIKVMFADLIISFSKKEAK